MATPKSISLEELQETLSARKGAQIVTIVANVEPEMRKGKGESQNPYIGRVRKVSTVNGLVNWNYQNSVNNQRVREDLEPDFEPEPRKWGVRIKGLPFVTHTRKGDETPRLYLELKVQKVLGTVYLLDNQPVPKEVLEPWLPAPREEGARQGVENPVVLRDYALENLEAITVSGETLVLRKPR